MARGYKGWPGWRIYCNNATGLSGVGWSMTTTLSNHAVGSHRRGLGRLYVRAHSDKYENVIIHIEPVRQYGWMFMQHVTVRTLSKLTSAKLGLPSNVHDECGRPLDFRRIAAQVRELIKEAALRHVTES